MFNPITAAALARARRQDLLIDAHNARRAHQARRAPARHQAEIGVLPPPAMTCGEI
ncbi:MAG TPA: hypothetical protein VLB85_07240 [Acidimicrobiia bacterium]|nr:hypothetical protein [Acidimicrobiia bacterium]